MKLSLAPVTTPRKAQNTGLIVSKHFGRFANKQTFRYGCLPLILCCSKGEVLNYRMIQQSVKNRYPKWSPGKWNQGLKPAVFRWFYFDPYPHGISYPGSILGLKGTFIPMYGVGLGITSPTRPRLHPKSQT